MHEAIAAASAMRRFELQDFPVAVAQAGVFVRPASANGRDSCRDSPMTPTHEFMKFGLAVTDDSAQASAKNHSCAVLLLLQFADNGGCAS